MRSIPVHYLKNYAFCPRKLYFKTSKDTLPLNTTGIVRKRITTMFNEEEPLIVLDTESILPLPELVERYKKHYGKKTRELIEENKEKMKEEETKIPNFIKRLWPKVMNESELRAKNLHKIMDKTGLAGKPLWDALSPKLITNVHVEGLEMKGKIELIKEFPSESIPYVFTAKKPPKHGVWKSDKLQAGAYILLLESKGVNCEEARIVYVGEKEDAEREVIMNGFLKDRILKTRDAVIALLESKKAPEPCGHCKKEYPCYKK